MDWSEGDLVWFDPGLGHPIPGKIEEVHRAAQVIIVNAMVKGKQQTFTLAPGEGNLRPRQDLGANGFEDMTQLDDLHEASLLWNLRIRYDKGLIYTFAGSILIAVNPYKMFPDAYGLEIAKQYVNKPLGVCPPHLFAIGAAAHASLPTPQVVVISGESGSGKTESTKLVMQYLAAVVPGGGSTSAVITEQILEAAPLLEAFGNARSTKNDNSSRFGKYLEVYFKSGAIVGAKITQYLLEKSRIVTQAQGERNYHVFYEMLGGLSETERSSYGLLDASKYFYLNQGGTDCASGRIDWDSLQGAMQVLGVSDIERDSIVRVLASILHLGNIYFHRRQLRYGQEGVELGSDAEIKWAAHLLQISAEDLHRSLTTRVTEASSERVYTALGIDQALDARDAFAKVLYAGLFNWLVSKVNSIVHKGGTHDAHRISILDIFGFENLTENSFEQLCINFANENLQLYFNKHVFKLEQAEYARERLEWSPLTWEDNLPVIHLLAKKPVGIFHLLDDESNFPRASDSSFLEKCHYNHALNELYSRPRIGAQEFGVTHYAGQVWYCVEGFLDKNRDALRTDVLELLASSKLSLVSELTKQLRAQRDIGKTLPKGSDGRFVTMKPRTPTVAARFSDSLQQLLQSMSKCNPWFVRCIKPNNDKQALKMDMPCVLQQLRYLGMLDTIKIRQKGYPVRLRFQHFVERYRHLMTTTLPRGTPYRELCRNVLQSLPKTNVEGPDFQLGATRVFLREALHRALESSRSERLRNAAVIIQKSVRGMLERKNLQRKRRAAIKIQSVWRGHKEHKKYKNIKKATVQAQALWRGKMQRKRYQRLKVEMKRRQEAIKAQKERQLQLAKETQEMHQISYLDVPAELAFVFSKIESWTPVHGDRHLVKIFGTVPGPPPPLDLPKDLDQFTFGKFSSVYCNGLKLSPRREPITTPFLSRTASRDQDFQDSLAIFKLILRWTSETSLDGNKEKALADYIIHKGLSSRSLRDEILVQLCNQVYMAEKNQAQRIWQLMAQCLSCFQPGSAFAKYLLKFISDNAPSPMKEILIKKVLRNTGNSQITPYRKFPPAWMEWRAITKFSDLAIALTLPNDGVQTVGVDSWTTCEEAAALAVSTLGISNQGWTVVLDDSGVISDSCGLDYVLDLISERELCPAFPALRNELLKTGSPATARTSVIETMELNSPKRPQIPPPEPPEMKVSPMLEAPITKHLIDPKLEYSKHYEGVPRKTSHEVLSRSSVLNERYFETDKSRSRSLDDLLAGESGDILEIEKTKPLDNIGLSNSRLNDRYHSAERLPPMSKETVPRYQKSQYAGRRSAGSHSSKYIDKSEYATRSSAMSDTSETPSLASHVRRVRVPSQASDVDQFLDDLFSPVLDGSLDELSDARSLAASIRGGGTFQDFFEAPAIDDSVSDLASVQDLCNLIKGGAHRNDVDNKTPSKGEQSSQEYMGKIFQPIVMNETKRSFEEKIEIIQGQKGSTSHQSGVDNGFSTSPPVLSPINSLGSVTTNPLLMMGAVPPEALIQMVNIPPGVDPGAYQQQMQRAFLQSAMAQNLQIQQQLLAQNHALQTLLSQQETPTSPPSVQRATTKTQVQTTVTNTRKQSIKNRLTQFSESERNRKASSESNVSLIPPPPPPPMPPPIEFKDPSEARPFIDPYGRAKTVRIGKWRWPPPQDSNQNETEEDFIFFKMRQNQRKNTPQSQNHSSNGSPNGSTIEWEEFEIDGNQFISIQSSPQNHQHHHHQQNQQHQQQQHNTTKEHYQKKISKQESQTQSGGQQAMAAAHGSSKSNRRSFEIGAERPPPGSVGKLKLSSEMRQRLEQVTAGHSVRSSISTRSEQRAPAKLEDARKMMLQQQLSGNLFAGIDGRAESPDLISVRSQVQRMEGSKKAPPPPWPVVVPPAPSGPAPPPPIRPPSIVPPAPPPAPGNLQMQQHGANNEPYQGQQQYQDIPAFVQRQERDTFGARHNWNGSDTSKDTYDSWGRNDAAKLNMSFDSDYKKDIEHARSRSRSRSRDRDNFSEAVWDRSEVEGPPSNFSDREREKEHQREKRENHYEAKEVEREKESRSVSTSSVAKTTTMIEKEISHRKESTHGPRPIQTNGRATFKTHMEQKYAKERERKISASTLVSQNADKSDDFGADDNWVVPAIPAPVPAPATSKSPVNSCLTYNRVTWKLRVRKEVFHPNEQIGPPAALELLFIQIASDVLGITPCLRISPQERRSAINLLNSHGVTVENIRGQLRAIIKRHLIDMARSWPLYFARLFVVNGAPQFVDVSILAISHNGVFLARKDQEHLTVIRSIPFSELQGAVTLPRPASLQLVMANGNRLNLHANRATAIQAMIQQFLQEFRMVQSKSSTPSTRTKAAVQSLELASERQEPPREYHHQMVSANVSSEKIISQRSEHTTSHQTNHHASSSTNHHQQSYHHGGNMNAAMHETSNEANRAHSLVKQSSYLHSRKSSGNVGQPIGVGGHDTQDAGSGLSPSVTKYSLLQFAMQHFREDEIMEDHKMVSTNARGDKKSYSYQPHADLVKWQGNPIRSPLLRLPPDLAPLALECFDCILRYCGDIPPDPELTEVKCVYTVLMHCHKYLALRDEVYCQLMKQTTANRSPCPDSSQRAWRLLSILAAYFGCSNALKPYLMEHLTVAASDRRRSCHGTAAVCLTNLRKTARCGGRKNVPSVEEVTAVSAGRSARRQIYRLPGGAERVVNTRCSTVVADVIAELCGLLGIESEAEQQEFSLYCIVQGDAFTMPLAADEYILDVSTELLKSGQPFYLIFCRSVWHFPLKRDPAPTPLYTEVLFNQVAPDYLEGLLLEFPNNGMPSPDVVHDMARIAALLHRAADLSHVPTMKEIKFLLPKPALGIRELRPVQWVSLVQTAWATVTGLTPTQVKAQFLNVLSAWPLFGSSFFAVKRVWAEDDPNIEDSSPMWRDLILVLNRRGVLFLDPNTHETLQHWPFMEVISTRKVRSEDGALFLDMKVGNLMQQRVVRVQTEQAHEISRLVRQYITMAQVSQKDRRD